MITALNKQGWWLHRACPLPGKGPGEWDCCNYTGAGSATTGFPTLDPDLSPGWGRHKHLLQQKWCGSQAKRRFTQATCKGI